MHPRPATVSDHFMADHERLERLLDGVLSALKAGDTDGASRLWGECRTNLTAHLEAEEENLVPWLLPRSERAARVIVQEHRHIRARSKELDAAMASREATFDTVRDFSDELRAHSQSEERLLYRWTDTHLDEPQRMLAIEALTV